MWCPTALSLRQVDTPGGIIFVKLRGRWRALPPLLFLTVGLGTGFSLMGRFWLDTLESQRVISGDMPTAHSEATRLLTEVSRSSIQQNLDALGLKPDVPVVFDMVCPTIWLPHKGHWLVTVSFLTPLESPVYVDCAKHRDAAWQVIRLYRKKLVGDRTEEKTYWERPNEPGSAGAGGR